VKLGWFIPKSLSSQIALVMVAALLVASAVAFVNHYGMPWSLRWLRDYVIQMRSDLISQVIQPGRFSSPEMGLTFHIRDR